MSIPITRFCTLLLALLFTAAAVARNITVNSTLAFDKAGTPSGINTGNIRAGEPYHVPVPGSVNGAVCGSASDTTSGACPTKLKVGTPLSGNYASNDFGGDVRLRFTSQNRQTKDLTLKASYFNACFTQFRLWEFSSNCSLYNVSIQFRVRIPLSSLQQLPVGVWTGTLKMYPRHSATDNSNMGTWTFNFTLRVSDTGSQQIYFPAFPRATPRVSLNLANRPGSGANTTVSGSNSLDMCLYDGSNSSSRRISLSFWDEGAAAPGRPAGMFSVYRDGGNKSTADNRIDYRVSVINPTTGGRQDVSNGSSIVWTNTNRRNILRQVVLPGVPGVSLCVPAPITLETPAFRLANKQTGHYTGKLRVYYIPTTQTTDIIF